MTRSASPDAVSASGVMLAIGAYGAWGVVPLFWHELRALDAVEILAHRVAWSLVFVTAALGLTGRFKAARAVLADAKLRRRLLLTSALISVNWGVFIWSVSTHRLVDASLGYFINPLVNVALGVAVLREHLRRLQLIAVALGAVGLVGMIAAAHTIPWLALLLAATFAGYGLLRKTAPVESLVGLFVESLVVAPLAIGYIVWREATHHGVLFGGDARLVALVIASGPVTALPLAAFAAAARRLPLTRLGFFQYLSPSLQVLIAVWVFGEPLGAGRLGAFAIIWFALGVSSLDLIFSARLRGR
ncbi:MAG: EamA family transporter RarD [Polyangiaceae bacterium]